MEMGFTSATYLYTDAGYSDIGTATGISLNSKLPKTPEWMASAGIQYSVPLDDHGFLTFQGDWSYKGKTYSDVQNFEAAAQVQYVLADTLDAAVQ